MKLIIIVSCVLIKCLASAFEDASKYINGDSRSMAFGLTNMPSKDKPGLSYNSTYIDKDENMLRVPVLNNYYEDHKSKKKTYKKLPRRTIQKIIKKNKTKVRKLYFHRAVTNRPTSPPKIKVDKIYAQDEYQWKEDSSTTQVNHIRKQKKWNPKVARYPMPFQRLQSKKENGKRYKRSDGREDAYILKDLDEIEFLGRENDNTVVNAHVKKYW